MKLTLILLLIFGTNLQSQTSDDGLSYIRKVFHSEVSEENLNTIISFESKDETIMAYQATCKTMMAEFVSSPFSKLSYFNEGKDELEKNISAHKTLEKVYLRLLIQLNIPGILNYNDEINEDLDFFIRNIKNTPFSKELQQTFKDSLLACKNISDYPNYLSKLKNLDL